MSLLIFYEPATQRNKDTQVSSAYVPDPAWLKSCEGIMIVL